MSAKNNIQKIILMLFIIFLAFILTFTLISCKQSQEKIQEKPSNTRNIVVIEEIIPPSNITGENEAIILDTTKTITLSENKTSQPEEEQEDKEEAETLPKQTPEASPRASAVEFYFLLKGKSYFRYTLKENEIKYFNMSGTIVKIEPVFIANDSVKFMIDEQATKAIAEKEWYSTPNYELYVNDIYYRR